MKRKFSKILGVGLTLALLFSLLLTAAPVSADVSKPTVDVDPDEISLKGTYTISFRINKELVTDTVPTPVVNATITVRFPEDTDLGDATAGLIAGDVAVTFTSGIGYSAGSATGKDVDLTQLEDRIVEIELTGFSQAGTAADPKGIGAMAYVQVVIRDSSTTGANGVTNPTETGVYTLEVKTSAETDYVKSESYDIDAPVVGGFVYVYNPSNVLMATFGGSAALNNAQVPINYYDKEGFTIKVGPGTYKLDLLGTPTDITISGKDMTLESADGAEDTIIDGNGVGILISGKGVTIDGFTIDDAASSIVVDGEDAIVTNCIITDDSVAGITIRDGGLDATVSDNVIEDCKIGIHFEPLALAGVPPALVDMDDVDIEGNEITEANTGGAIVFGGGNKNIDITGNTITGNETNGIYFANVPGNEPCDDITIKGNTITLNDGNGIQIADADTPPATLVITENDILDNEDDGVLAETWVEASSYVMFNNIVGNEDSVDNDAADTINARFNWWGTTDDDDFDEQGLVDVEPWLMDAQEAVVSGSKVATDASSLDAKTAADVKVSGVEETHLAGSPLVPTPFNADIISAAKYIANPEDALDDAIAFYDVFVRLETDFDTADVTAKLKFYDSAMTTGSVANFWTGDFWAECSDQEARDGIIYVTVSDDTLPALDELEETIFAVVAGEAVTEFGAPTIAAPENGADDVSLTPTFAWSAVTGADGYYFQFADNANFVTPLVKLDGDLGRLIVTAYAYVTELPYSTAYYWRVKAVSGSVDAGDLVESDWASGVFITKAEAEEPTPPVVVEPAPPAPIITIEQPDIIVPLPKVAAPITPAWIYVIIAVGAVLVIALLVLIVRTRRVA